MGDESIETLNASSYIWDVALTAFTIDTWIRGVHDLWGEWREPNVNKSEWVKWDMLVVDTSDSLVIRLDHNNRCFRGVGRDISAILHHTFFLVMSWAGVGYGQCNCICVTAGRMRDELSTSTHHKGTSAS